MLNLGAPYKSKVQRLVKSLERERLVRKERGEAALTPKGETTAKKVAYNRQTAGATYG